MKTLVIFGIGDAAELAAHYFENDSDLRVEAFCVDDAYAVVATKFGKPVIKRSELQKHFPPGSCQLFVAIGYSAMNDARATKVEEFLAAGYSLASYVSSKSICYAKSIGANAFILEGTIIQPFVEVGQNVWIWSGAHIGHHSRIEDHVFIAPCAALSGRVRVGAKSFIGLNASIKDHVALGRSTLVGAGANVVKDTSEFSVIVGGKASETGKKSSLTRI